MKKKFYNLIEITMAIAVVGIGISAVMGLLPAALNATKDTVANNYIGGIAETFSSYLESKMKRPPTTDNPTPWTTMKEDTLITLDDAKKISENANFKAITYPSSSITHVNETSFPGLFTLETSQVIEEKPVANFLYYVKAGDSFTGFVFIWCDKVDDIYDPETKASLGDVDPKNEKIIRIYMELSWPATAPYAEREKRLFVTEFYNPNYVAP